MWVCDSCQIHAVLYICICNRRFCKNCHSKHCSNASEDSMHRFLSVQRPDFSETSRSPESPQSLEQLTGELREEMQDFRKVSEEYLAFAKTLTQQVTEVLANTVSCLERNEKPLWNYSVLTDVQEVFMEVTNPYKAAVESAFARLQIALEMIPSLQFRSSAMPLYYIQDHLLSHFDCVKRTWSKSIELQSSIVTLGAWDLVLNSAEPQILHTGGTTPEGPINTVQVVNGIRGTVEAREAMLYARKDHCGVQVEGQVYVFGGRDSSGKLDLAERYDLQTGQWAELPRMQRKRFKFSPVHFQDLIILAGGCDKSIECFHLVSLEYDLLPLEFPRDSPCLTVLLPSTDLLTLTAQGCYQWSLAAFSAFQPCIFNLGFYTAPLLHADHIFLLDYQKVKALPWNPLGSIQEYSLSF